MELKITHLAQKIILSTPWEGMIRLTAVPATIRSMARQVMTPFTVKRVMTYLMVEQAMTVCRVEMETIHTCSGVEMEKITLARMTLQIGIQPEMIFLNSKR